MQNLEFYQNHLDRVSRSFAVCISKLDEPFRQWISLSYLLCRVLDTVEDAPWNSQEEQQKSFTAFEHFLSHSDVTALRIWQERFPTQIPDGEIKLLADSELLFQDLHQLPEEIREVIIDCVKRMKIGMTHFANRRSSKGLALQSYEEVNRYCYFVAGLVGELLTRLFLQYRKNANVPPEMVRNSCHFGLFLQKINLLKDQLVDEKEGRYLLPERERVLASLSENAEGAMCYLLSIPPEERGYRTFCAWSLFLGLASVPFIESSFINKMLTKIPRSVTEILLQRVESRIQNDEDLKKYFSKHFEKLPKINVTKKAISPSSWFRSCVPLSMLSDVDLALLELS